MATLYEHEVLIDSIRSAISDLGMVSDDLDVVLKTLSTVAMDDANFKEKFIYTMQPEAYQTSAQKTDLVEIGIVNSETIPKLEVPVYSFKRDTKPVIRLQAKLDSDSKAMFNRHYGDEAEIHYGQVIDHDHATAAMSRKIEYDILLKHAWENYCNPLLLPTNYDFSVIDVGGDWGTVLSRKQYGIHVCNPILDTRDRTRDIRKRMRDSTGFSSTAYVCRDTLQSCCKTAPVAISLHSSYDIDPKDIVTSMVKRGIIVYTGTMFLPENLEKITKYSDKNYGYNIVVDKPNALMDKVFSHMSGNIRESRIKGETLIIYSFPNGESREYSHDYNRLLKYTKHRTYKVRVDNSTEDIIIDYKITRRVGSLVYFEFKQNFEKQPANISVAKTIQKEPFNGYRAKLDASFLRNTLLHGLSPIEVLIPRGLFDVVASYCLTRVTAEDFTIENALAYTRSVMSSIQINESTLVLNDGDDSFELMVACSIAAYQWAHERYRLLESRVPHRNFIEQYFDTNESLDSLVEMVLSKEKLLSEAKSTLMKVGSSIIDNVLIDNPGLRNKLAKVLSLLKAIKSPCLLELTDMEFLVEPIEIVQHELQSHDGSTQDTTLISPNCGYMLPTYPDYNQTVLPSIGKSTHRKSRLIETEKLINEITEKRFRNLPNYNTLQPIGVPVPLDDIEAIIEANADEEEIDEIEMKRATQIEAINEHEKHVKAVKDFIHLAREGDREHEDSAVNAIEKVMTDQYVPSMLDIRADIKNEPLVLACVNGKVISLKDKERTYHAGEAEFKTRLDEYNKSWFCTKLYQNGNSVPTFKRIMLNDGQFDLDTDSVVQTFDAVYISQVQILISKYYTSLFNYIGIPRPCEAENTSTTLTNGVAGCGKTHTQVHSFAKNIAEHYNPAIFSATRAAAAQALSRLKEMHVPATSNNVCTIDSFLMNKRKWKAFTHIYVDEALQLHCGKLFAVLEITSPEQMIGFGDRQQITFINFTRSALPSVDTNFPWKGEVVNKVTRRIKEGPRIKWLQNPELYGPEFSTAAIGKDSIRKYAQFAGLEKALSIKWIYSVLRLDPSEPLLVLVYRRELAMDLRMKLQVGRHIPEINSEHRMGLETIGESQGEDVAHSVVLRLSPKDEALYAKEDQTIVALTRSFTSWSYLTVPSAFPSLLEKVVAKTETDIKLVNMQLEG